MSVTATTDGGVGRIVLDRPPANSYDPELLEELDAAIGTVVDAGVPVAVVASANEKFFSAGADVKGFLARNADENMAMVRRAHEIFDRFAAEAPVFVAHLAGHALGGGYEIALACDVRIAESGSYRIGLPEATLGLLPGTGGTQRLPRLVGPGQAIRLMTTGAAVGPEEAHRLGMVDVLVDPGEAEATLAELTGALASGARQSIAAVKRAVHDGLSRSLGDGLAREQELMEPLFATEDAREGMTAFTERRAPEFTGR